MIDYREVTRNHNTPIFLIDLDKLKNNYVKLKNSCLGAAICYSQKTNPHPSIILKIIKLGGMVAVSSIKELRKVLELKVPSSKIIYHPVAETETEIEFAFRSKVFLLIANSINELIKFGSISKKLRMPCEIGLRINFGSLTNLNKVFSKFGIHTSEIEEAKEIMRKNEYITITTLCCHAGTNIIDPTIFDNIYAKLKQINIYGINKIDIGGGFPSSTTLDENSLSIDDYFVKLRKYHTVNHHLLIEPGRFLVEDACYCITKAVSINHNWVILDISSNFLLPLANADYQIRTNSGKYTYNFAGRLCFGADIIKNNVQSDIIKTGDTFIIKKCGAYTYAMKNSMGYDDPTIIVKDNDELTIG